ncbi:MAG: hypothetical protein ACREMN_01200 [Gemmatimonadales bacterium]
MLDAKRVLPLLFVLSVTVLPLEAQRSSRDFIAAEEIEGLGSTPGTAFDIVRSLRPYWLRATGVLSLPSGSRDMQVTEVHVYVDEQDMGTVDYLRTIPAERVLTLRYLSTTEAGARYGPSAGPGIAVTLKR